MNLLATLRALPPDTLGREYAIFLDANGIAPLVISPSVRERFRREPYALRHTTTHDLHHVLAGFDTGLAGEVGVLAFNVGQRAAPVSRTMLSVVRVLYTLASPPKPMPSPTTSASASRWVRRRSSSSPSPSNLISTSRSQRYAVSSSFQIRATLTFSAP